MVSGFLQAKEYGRRKQFAQTFFLAPQEKGYFVLNDILYFIHEEELHHHPASLLPHGNFDSKLNVPNPLPEAGIIWSILILQITSNFIDIPVTDNHIYSLST